MGAVRCRRPSPRRHGDRRGSGDLSVLGRGRPAARPGRRRPAHAGPHDRRRGRGHRGASRCGGCCRAGRGGGECCGRDLGGEGDRRDRRGGGGLDGRGGAGPSRPGRSRSGPKARRWSRRRRSRSSTRWTTCSPGHRRGDHAHRRRPPRDRTGTVPERRQRHERAVEPLRRRGHGRRGGRGRRSAGQQAAVGPSQWEEAMVSAARRVWRPSRAGCGSAPRSTCTPRARSGLMSATSSRSTARAPRPRWPGRPSTAPPPPRSPPCPGLRLAAAIRRRRRDPASPPRSAVAATIRRRRHDSAPLPRFGAAARDSAPPPRFGGPRRRVPGPRAPPPAARGGRTAVRAGGKRQGGRGRPSGAQAETLRRDPEPGLGEHIGQL